MWRSATLPVSFCANRVMVLGWHCAQPENQPFPAVFALIQSQKTSHAMQDANDYSPLRIRAALVPAANLGSQLCWPLIIIGLLLGGSSVLLNLGILLFCLAVLFQLVTLPVEYDASHRAVTLLDSTGILAGQEVGQTRKVLNAAALTYVAAAAASILQLLRLLILFGNRRND